MFWLLGGASFIGSHVVDKLISVGANVTVVNNLSCGKLENARKSWNKIKTIKNDLEYITKDDINNTLRSKNSIHSIWLLYIVKDDIFQNPSSRCKF
jgi:UDP-glucose 4-epimerase